MWNGLILFEPLADFGDGLFFVTGYLFVFHRRVGQSAGKWIKHDFHQMNDGGDLAGTRWLSSCWACSRSLFMAGPMLSASAWRRQYNARGGKVVFAYTVYRVVVHPLTRAHLVTETNLFLARFVAIT